MGVGEFKGFVGEFKGFVEEPNFLVGVVVGLGELKGFVWESGFVGESL